MTIFISYPCEDGAIYQVDFDVFDRLDQIYDVCIWSEDEHDYENNNPACEH